jgi:glycosidase
MMQSPRMEFHVSRRARDTYGFDASLFSLTENVVFADFRAARVFAERMNRKRDLVRFPERAVTAGSINAMGLIDEILHYVVGLFRRQRNAKVLGEAAEWLTARIGETELDRTLREFIREFPPVAVYRGEIRWEDWLTGESGGVPHRQVALEELLMLWLANANPAYAPYGELFDDARLTTRTAYGRILASLHDFFDGQPVFGPDHQNLIDMLRAPAVAVPHSLPGQLEYIRTRWGHLLGDFLPRLLSSLDLVKEEGKARFLGPGPVGAHDLSGLALEPRRFSPDRDWMPKLVLIAKNVYVWMDQLSRWTGRSLTRLDQIPEEELDRLARWGFTGLWLIGLWERSAASRRIKQLRGNPEAVASAYSLFAYEIAADLGGDDALRTLRERAGRRGIRLASDMVPNHVGIDGRWVVEHPDWFVGLDHSPFPAYTFQGPNLSQDDRVGIFLEDHYYDHSDAAVVFKRVDLWTGSERFLYHGNDGTSMPWNDTAQLDYLKAEVREAAIQTILSVARRFPVIRFDAAMTLAKRHFQRLWYPEPGSGGDIPSRAEHGLTKAEFDRAMPREFWREVVDRVAADVPDTLLLAEAFWLMEGYFVRTLGMHRVYNSAFMVMLRDERNQDYRQLIKNTLEFDPEILKRYVNFMNNPDERTAVDQFGKEDKFFGVCTMMVTLPGLPMFGHGQIEGFTEKYGMEYRRAYHDERPDDHLVSRHEREIFPLLRRRHVFAEARDFLLYDFFLAEGRVNEDVFAYSNRAGDERALLIYHNRYASTGGWIRTSTPCPVAKGSDGRFVLVQKTLGEGLGLNPEAGFFTVFRDHHSGLEYLRSNRELLERGLYVELDAYKCHVFLDFREVRDDGRNPWARLSERLDGRGVPSVDEALQALVLEPVHGPLRELARPERFRRLAALAIGAGPADEVESALDDVKTAARTLAGAARDFCGGTGTPEEIAARVRDDVAVALRLPAILGKTHDTEAADPWQGDDPVFWAPLLGWLFLHRLGEATGGKEATAVSRAWIDEWRLGTPLIGSMRALGLEEDRAEHAVSLVKILIGQQDWARAVVPPSKSREKSPASGILRAWLGDEEMQRFLNVNRAGGKVWFGREPFREWLEWALVIAGHRAGADTSDSVQAARRLRDALEVIRSLREAESRSGYEVDRLLEAVDAGRTLEGERRGR